MKVLFPFLDPSVNYQIIFNITQFSKRYRIVYPEFNHFTLFHKIEQKYHSTPFVLHNASPIFGIRVVILYFLFVFSPFQLPTILMPVFVTVTPALSCHPALVAGSGV
jgi:hypothetical protein